MFGFHCKAIGKIVTSDHCEKMRKLGKLRVIEPCSTCEDWKVYFAKAIESDDLVVPTDVVVKSEKEPKNITPPKLSLQQTHFKLGRKCKRCKGRIADWNKGDLCTKCKKKLRIYSTRRGNVCKGDNCDALLSDKNVTGYCRKCGAKNRVATLLNGSSSIRILQQEKIEVLKRCAALEKQQLKIKTTLKQVVLLLEGLLDGM